MLSSIIADTFSIGTFLLCTLSSLVMGFALAWLHERYNNSSKGFIITIALLPALV